MTPEQWLQEGTSLAFLGENRHADARALMLKYAGDQRLRFLAEQVAARRRIRKKLPSYYNNLHLWLPASHNLEQCSSEATARLKASLLSGGQKFCDLSGGLGIDCMALGQKFAQISYVEPDTRLHRIVAYNAEQLSIELQQKQCSAEEALQNLAVQDFLYIDPSRREVGARQAFALSDYQPNVLELQEALLATAPQVLVKCSPMLSIGASLRQLQSVAEVWVISLRNECKELLFLLKREAPTRPLLRTWNLLSNGEIEYLEQADEAPALPPAATAVQQYLYEANAAIMKAGLQDQAAGQWGLAKLAPESHLYTAADLQASFPGRIWRVKKMHRPYAVELKNRKLNLVNRNFYEPTARIEKKLRLQPGEDYLLASTLGRKGVFVEAERLR